MHAAALALTTLCLVPGNPALANQLENQVKSVATTQPATRTGIKDGAFIAVPIPFSNPTIGSGLILGAGYLFTSQGASKPSGLGVGALRSDNGSEVYGGQLSFASQDNRWLFSALFGTAHLNYDLYTRFDKLPLRQEGDLARLTLAYGVTPELSFGGTLRYLDTTINLDRPGRPPLPGLLIRDSDLKLANVGITAQWDRRNDALYPTMGTDLYFEASHGSLLDGRTRTYNKAYFTFDMYHSLSESGVVAARLAGCATSEDTPFFDKCSLGGTDAFRGFSATEYLADRLASVQFEYRQVVTERLGAVVFAGSGWTGSGLGSLNEGGAHSAAGVGLRYRVSKKYPVDLSIDGSTNNQGDDLLYIYVGQRF